jgi:hypothetical protein
MLGMSESSETFDRLQALRRAAIVNAAGLRTRHRCLILSPAILLGRNSDRPRLLAKFVRVS